MKKKADKPVKIKVDKSETTPKHKLNIWLIVSIVLLIVLLALSYFSYTLYSANYDFTQLITTYNNNLTKANEKLVKQDKNVLTLEKNVSDLENDLKICKEVKAAEAEAKAAAEKEEKEREKIDLDSKISILKNEVEQMKTSIKIHEDALNKLREYAESGAGSLGGGYGLTEGNIEHQRMLLNYETKLTQLKALEDKRATYN